MFFAIALLVAAIALLIALLVATIALLAAETALFRRNSPAVASVAFTAATASLTERSLFCSCCFAIETSLFLLTFERLLCDAVSDTLSELELELLKTAQAERV